MANHLSFDVLSRLIESRASEGEEARAERHLATCPRCRSERDWLERIRGQPRPPGASTDTGVGPGVFMH